MKKFLSIVLTITLLMSTFEGTSCFAKKSFCNNTVTETYDAVQDVYSSQKENQVKEKSNKSKVKIYSALAGAATIALGALGAAAFLAKKFLPVKISAEVSGKREVLGECPSDLDATDNSSQNGQIGGSGNLGQCPPNIKLIGYESEKNNIVNVNEIIEMARVIDQINYIIGSEKYLSYLNVTDGQGQNTQLDNADKVKSILKELAKDAMGSISALVFVVFPFIFLTSCSGAFVCVLTQNVTRFFYKHLNRGNKISS